MCADVSIIFFSHNTIDLNKISYPTATKTPPNKYSDPTVLYCIMQSSSIFSCFDRLTKSSFSTKNPIVQLRCIFLHCKHFSRFERRNSVFVAIRPFREYCTRRPCTVLTEMVLFSPQLYSAVILGAVNRFSAY